MKIFTIGAGNLAHYFAAQLNKNSNIKIEGGYVRNRAQASAFIEKCKFPITDDWGAIPKNMDVYVLAVNDSAIEELAQQLDVHENALVIHCAGSQPLNLIGAKHKNKGIIWPLYSITKQLSYESDIPLVIDATNESTLDKVNRLAQALSKNIHTLNYDKRRILHLNAVLVNNFSNHLFAIAEQLCVEQAIDFNILKPIITQTVTRLEHQSAKSAQTGPAIRGDENTINAQIELLAANPLWRQIYKAMSASIIDMKHTQLKGKKY
jgi:predicted short-subunit dehydrogenase-like oxidoreductase (DUF2520 family)